MNSMPGGGGVPAAYGRTTSSTRRKSTPGSTRSTVRGVGVGRITSAPALGGGGSVPLAPAPAPPAVPGTSITSVPPDVLVAVVSAAVPGGGSLSSIVAASAPPAPPPAPAAASCHGPLSSGTLKASASEAAWPGAIGVPGAVVPSAAAAVAERLVSG